MRPRFHLDFAKRIIAVIEQFQTIRNDSEHNVKSIEEDSVVINETTEMETFRIIQDVIRIERVYRIERIHIVA